MHVDWIGALAVAIIVVGIIQYLKGLFPKETKSWVWATVNAAGCLGVALAEWLSKTTDLGSAIILGGLAIAISQLAYEVIVQGVPNLVSAVLQSVAGSVPAVAPPPAAAQGSSPVATEAQMSVVVGMKTP
jgi:hypothetical protein